jgi:hypothetical protein
MQNMATYQQIKTEAEKHAGGKKIETCYIADIIKLHGLSNKIAANRSGILPKKPCPSWAKSPIETAMKKFGII